MNNRTVNEIKNNTSRDSVNVAEYALSHEGIRSAKWLKYPFNIDKIKNYYFKLLPAFVICTITPMAIYKTIYLAIPNIENSFSEMLFWITLICTAVLPNSLRKLYQRVLMTIILKESYE